ncbi:proton-conducting transporter transmembrane domain-containing protein [Phenylobacterium sp.]|uniref:proton-conducting transporter transmembrane domain-containing protein n=1 Tax=Phenylobacterium sp. TaxID=1871053 RepID=UPI002FDA9329
MSLIQTLLFLAPGLPLLMAIACAAPRLRPVMGQALALAPLPALALALLAAPGLAQPLPDALLGAGLRVEATGRLFLGTGALLWTLAGAYVRLGMSDADAERLAGWWLATLAGNMLLFLAADVVTFYLAFALLSLSAFGLIVHSRSEEARRAGRIYLVLAIFGETCLLLGFMLGAQAAGAIQLQGMDQAILASPWRDMTLGLLITGFGIKLGLIPLHVWLPLAHPAAPPAASAVLSGAIVKAGLFGLLTFLPFGAGLDGWGAALTAVGLLTAFGGVLLGAFQQRPKTVLAYSTLSQMGVLTAALGAALTTQAPQGLLTAAAYYSAHHGLAKGALFLAVGALALAGPRLARPLRLAAALMALAIAGLPLTGGALAKLSLKSALEPGLATTLIALSAAGTTVLMLRFLQLAWRIAPAEPQAARPGPALAVFACATCALILPWSLLQPLAALTPGYALSLANLWESTWPLILGLTVVGLIRLAQRAGWRAPALPEGDLVVPAARLLYALREVYQGALAARPRPQLSLRLPDPGPRLERLEQRLALWPVGGGLALLMLAALALAVLADTPQIIGLPPVTASVAPDM